MAKSKRVPKTVLKLPDLEQSKSAVLNSLTPRLAFNRTVVTRYRIAPEQHPYAPSTIRGLLLLTVLG
jgi:hypothetical protein